MIESTSIRRMTVDVHAHIFPPDLDAGPVGSALPRLVRDDSAAGRIMVRDREFRRVRSALWDLDARLAELDEARVDLQVVSPVPIVLDAAESGGEAHQFVRDVNDG